MAEIQETDEGFYVQSGDILEWKWKPGKAPGAEPVPEPKAEPQKVTTKTAAPLVGKK